MSVTRGDIVLVSVPFASGQGAKIRPVLVIQSDRNNKRLMNTLVAGITSNTSRVAHEPTQYLIDVSTPEGASSGLRFNSAVACEYLVTIEQSRILKRLGHLSPVCNAGHQRLFESISWSAVRIRGAENAIAVTRYKTGSGGSIQTHRGATQPENNVPTVGL